MKFRVHVFVTRQLSLCPRSSPCPLCVKSFAVAFVQTNRTHRVQTNPCSPNRNKRNKAPPIQQLPHSQYKIQFPGPIHPDATNSPATNPPKCATAPTPPPPARKNREKTLSSGILRAIRPQPAH